MLSSYFYSSWSAPECTRSHHLKPKNWKVPEGGPPDPPNERGTPPLALPPLSSFATLLVHLNSFSSFFETLHPRPWLLLLLLLLLLCVTVKSFCLQVRRELTEEKEKAQKVLMEKEAELAAVSKGRERMEKALKAHHVKSQIERETREDLHNATIQVSLNLMKISCCPSCDT